MLQLPLYIPAAFIAVVIVTLIILLYAIRRSSAGSRGVAAAAVIAIVWLGFQLVLSLRGFYTADTRSVPPRFGLLVLPPLVLIVCLFVVPRFRSMLDTLPLSTLALLSVVRIPVELCLYWLCIYRYVPTLMTFEGRNFDIISGITAPLIAYTWHRGLLHKNMLLLWHIAALLSLANIVINAVLSAPLAIQRFAFDQPNVALLHFPFVWLPCFVVPVVLFTHLVSIRRLLG